MRNLQLARACYKRYYEKHKKARNASARAYETSHRAKCNAQRRKRYRERMLEDATFREAYNKRHREYYQRYRPKNLAKVNSWIRRWNKKNTLKTKHYSLLRKARKSGARTDFEKCQEFLVWIRNQDFVSCTYCGVFITGRSVEIDHIVPLSRGGDHLPDNFCLACRSCNASKSDFLLSEWPKCPEKFRFIQV